MQHHYARVGFGTSEYRTNRSGDCPDGLIKMKSHPPHCQWVANKDGGYDELPPTDEQLAEQAQAEMITELNWCDLQLKYHATGDTKRAISTVELINAYAVDCRDYVQNVDGVLTIVGDKPERPE